MSGRNAQARRPTTEALSSPRSELVSNACSETDIAWPSTGSRYQPVVELQRSSVSELRCSNRVVSCHSSLRYCAPTNAAKKSSVIEPEASGAFGFSGSRSAPRSVLVWSTPTSKAQLSFHLKPCVRPKFANVRGPNSVACVLMLDFTCVRSHGRVRMPIARGVRFDLAAFGVFVFGEQRGRIAQVVVEADDAARRVVDACILGRPPPPSATSCEPRSVMRPVPEVDAAVDEGLVGHALVAARVFVGHVTRAAAHAVRRRA